MMIYSYSFGILYYIRIHMCVLFRLAGGGGGGCILLIWNSLVALTPINYRLSCNSHPLTLFGEYGVRCLNLVCNFYLFLQLLSLILWCSPCPLLTFNYVMQLPCIMSRAFMWLATFIITQLMANILIFNSTLSYLLRYILFFTRLFPVMDLSFFISVGYYIYKPSSADLTAIVWIMIVW